MSTGDFPLSWLGEPKDSLLTFVPGSDESSAKITFSLEVTERKPDGQVIEHGIVSRKVVTMAFVTKLVTLMAGGALGDFASFNWHATGTGSAAESTADTTLGAEVQTRVSGTQSTNLPGAPTAQYITQATVHYTGNYTIAEHGVFSASSSGTLLDRSVLSPAISVTPGTDLTFVYTFTVTAGG